MTISLQYTNVTVNDVDESLAFYRDGLGLEVQNDVASGRYRWVTLGSDAQPGLGIVISEPHAGRSKADGDAMQELLTKGVLPMLVFATDDIDTTFETVRASGAEAGLGVAAERDPAVRPGGDVVLDLEAERIPVEGERLVDVVDRDVGVLE